MQKKDRRQLSRERRRQVHTAADPPKDSTRQMVEIGGLGVTEHICTRCSYIYAAKDGDFTAGIPPGTEWDKLPEDWACPHCGIDKAQFEMRVENQA
jgi:rubredoxin